MRRILLSLPLLLTTLLFALPALAGNWGENWGEMVWEVISAPVPTMGLLGLTVFAMVLAATAVWALRKRRPALGLTLTLTLIAIPLAVAAGTLTVPNTFVNGTPADAGQINANFDAVEAEVNDNDGRISTAQSTADTAATFAATAQNTATTAGSFAATAQGTANTAITNAAAAQNTADTAITNAAAAQNTADTAITNAAAAQNTADGAVTDAAAAEGTANTAAADATAAQASAAALAAILSEDMGGQVTLADVLKIGTNGNVAINGSVNPTRRLTVYGDDGERTMMIVHKNNTNAAAVMINFNRGSSLHEAGLILATNTATTYATSSDVRRKENITASSGGLEKLSQIQVRDFNFIVDPDLRVQGYIAQELYDVYPAAVAVGATKDDYWAVDYGRLSPLIVLAIQELKAELESGDLHRAEASADMLLRTEALAELVALQQESNAEIQTADEQQKSAITELRAANAHQREAILNQQETNTALRAATERQQEAIKQLQAQSEALKARLLAVERK